MLMKEILDQGRISLSFEFFPPKTPVGWERLFDNIAELAPLAPSSVSVTYGAGGSTRSQTHDLVLRIHNEIGVTVVPHQTCVAATRDDVATILAEYEQNGIENVLALRGDPPLDDPGWTPPADGFEHAIDLVTFIRARFPGFSIGVAGFPEGHPEMPNRLQEIDYLKQKVDAGADYIVTQLFFDNRDFYDFCDRCRLAGIDVPIIAGIMPLRNRKGMMRMAELAAGARFPAPLLRRVTQAQSEEAVEQVGIDWAIEQVKDLVAHQVSGIHFYTLNSATATSEIFSRLGLR
ncbi:methylenetetrahydrofolate reductase [NAD(P)H] [uncultured Desulfuromonas sp.]|uniref:methylenetetrahydrofolate reductase [NAD(P)H] n=1 Tax=uncultured Desulfuromonas sp. TaxID=181013 RepID=UPI002AAAD972|nr:methylenetetrahydrofolate reductase [NAD(P)H] [uncultured Desulfuromonas sp.]